MLTPKVAASIEKWLSTAEGQTFAEKLKGRLGSLDCPEALVKIGLWPELMPFKNFLQITYNRPQKPGELKGCLERIDGIRVTGPVGQEVAGIVSKGDAYWSLYVVGGDNAVKPVRSWEDYFQVSDPNCFLGIIKVRPSVENPGNTWVELKDCKDATGELPGYSFSCKDEEVSGVVDGTLVLGRRNQLLPDRPFFFAGDRMPVEIVDWRELKIGGTARDFLSNNGRNRVRVDCKCYFKDLLVVDGDLIYSGMQFSLESGEVYVGDEWREGDAKKYFSENKSLCWTYLLKWGDEKGLYRLLAPKDGSGLTTDSLIANVGSQQVVSVTVDPGGACPWLRIHEDEEDFLSRFATYREQAHFDFSDRDVIRFHTGVKLGLVSLLTGDPGCGKSSLARLYANALSGAAQKPGKDSLFIRTFVNRTWISPYDMLGYPRRDGAEVQESDNGLLAFLRKASEDAERQRIRSICFEEMNLAQVEHYFSDFMQILSGDDARMRDPLPGFAKGGGSLPVGDNLVFIGTCNNDSTVRQFSSRFLDRCNLVDLSSRTDEGGFETVFADVSCDGALGECPISANQMAIWSEVCGDQLLALSKSEQNDFIAKLKPMFRDAGVPIDHRALMKISKYMCCRPRSTESAFAHPWYALDEALAQMVIPKIVLIGKAVKAAKDISVMVKAKFAALGFPLGSSLTVDALDRQIAAMRDSVCLGA